MSCLHRSTLQNTHMKKTYIEISNKSFPPKGLQLVVVSYFAVKSCFTRLNITIEVARETGDKTPLWILFRWASSQQYAWDLWLILLDTSWWCSPLQLHCYDCSLPPGQDVIRWLPTLLGRFDPEPQHPLHLLGQEWWPVTAHHLLTSRLKSSADSIFHIDCAGEQQLHWKRDIGFPDRVQSCTSPVCAAMCLFLLIMCTVGPPSPPVQMGRCWKGVTHWSEQKGSSSGNMICCGRSYWP